MRTILLGISLPKSADELIGFFNLGKARLTKYVNDMVQVGIDFKLTTLVKVVPKVAVKLEAALAVSEARPTLVLDMTTAFVAWLESSMNSRTEDLEDTIMAEALALGPEVDFNTIPLTQTEEELVWYRLICALYSPLPEEYSSKAEAFYQLLWKKLYGPALAGYIEVVRDVLFNVEGMAGKHRSNSMLVLPSFHGGSAYSYGFFQRYWDFLTTLEDLASVSPSVTNFSRPEGLEGVSENPHAVTPLHLRYYRM